jgi:hypothetical protein
VQVPRHIRVIALWKACASVPKTEYGSKCGVQQYFQSGASAEEIGCTLNLVTMKTGQKVKKMLSLTAKRKARSYCALSLPRDSSKCDRASPFNNQELA